MRINVAVPEAHVTKPVIDATLEGVTRLDEALIKAGTPTFAESVGAVKWRPEPPGDEHFDHAAKVLQRGWGDCDDLAPWHAASLRVTGEDPGATAIVRRSGPTRWHAVVQRSDGSIEDPSREAGMGRKTVHGVSGSGLPAMGPISSVVGDEGEIIQRPQLSARPIVSRGEIVGFEARVDMPFEVGACPSAKDGAAFAALARSGVASQSIVGACRGAVRLAEESDMVDGDVIDRVEVIGHYIAGVPLERLREIYGDEHALAAEQVGAGFFKMLGRGLKKVALPLTKKLVQFIPGIGPIASTALDMGEGIVKGAIKSGKKRRSNIIAPSHKPLIVPTSRGVVPPDIENIIRALAQYHGMTVHGDDAVIVGEDDGGELHEVGKIKFGKVFKRILMPHTFITDKLPKGMRRVLDPTSLVHDNVGRRRKRRARR